MERSGGARRRRRLRYRQGGLVQRRNRIPDARPQTACLHRRQHDRARAFRRERDAALAHAKDHRDAPTLLVTTVDEPMITVAGLPQPAQQPE